MNIQAVGPEVVVVKAFGGKALIRWLVGTTPTVAVITDSVGADAVRAGRAPEAAVGFPLNDVFKWDEYTRISDGDYPNWDEIPRRF